MRKVRGSATVEAAYVMPVVLITIIAVIYITFYLHDKNIIAGAAYETSVVVNEYLRLEEKETEKVIRQFFYDRIDKKLIIFDQVQFDLSVTETEITVSAKAYKGKMKIDTIEKYRYTQPEKDLRKIRRIYGNTV